MFNDMTAIGQDVAKKVRGDRLKRLRAFCYVARYGTTTKAAEWLSSSQSTVSQQIRALEEDLSVALFDRSGSRMSLSSMGKRLFEITNSLVMDVDRLAHTFAERFRGEVSGEVRIATGQTVATAILPECIKRFRVHDPGTPVEVVIAGGEEPLLRLRQYEVDLAFAAAEPVSPDIDYRPVVRSEMVLISPEGHPLAGSGTASLDEALRHKTVMPATVEHIATDEALGCWQSGPGTDPVVQVDGWRTIVAYVESGVGIAVVPDICVFGHDRVRKIPIAAPVPSCEYGLFMRRDGVPSLAAERFVQAVDEVHA